MTADESEQQATRREAIRDRLEEQPIVMAGDVAGDLGVSRKTARRYLKDVETDTPSVKSTQCSGGRVWYVKSNSDGAGDIPTAGQVEYHLRELWSDSRPGRALIGGLTLTAAVALLSPLTLSLDSMGWQAAHERLHTLVHALSLLAWPMLIGPAITLRRRGRLLP